MKITASLSFIFLFIFCAACKSVGKKKESENFFPVLSFIQSQVAHVDTSLYQIIKLTTNDSTWDTVYIKREEFRESARDFLALPDIADKKNMDNYQESKFFDATLNQVIITYKSNHNENEIQREEVIIQPGEQEPDKVKMIIVDKITPAKDGVSIKHMLWIVDKSFQVTTILQKSDKVDSSNTVKVTWN